MPLDRGIIDQQLQALGESPRWWDQRELRDLPAVLDTGEQILAIARGKIARVRWLRRPWLIVVTDRRLLGLRSASRSWRQIEVSAEQITRVSLRIGPFRGRLIFSAGGESYRLLLPRADAYRVLNALARYGPAREAVPGSAATRLVRRVVDHVMALPAAAFDPNTPRALPATPNAGTQKRLDALEEEVQQLRQQVDFLEELLRERQAAVGSAADHRT